MSHNPKDPLHEGYRPTPGERGYQPAPVDTPPDSHPQGGYQPTTQGENPGNLPEPPGEE